MNMFCVTIYNDHYDKIKNLGYIPVGLGENVSSNTFITDKTGANINKKNSFYGEYTFHYWIWKNKINNFKFTKFLKKNFIKMIKNPNLFFDKNKRNIKFHFDLMHGEGNLDKAISLLDNKDRNDFSYFVNSEVSFNPHNMFICKSNKILKDYYESVFPWLERCEKKFGFELEGYGLKRIYGFLAERYMSYWFKKYTNFSTMPIIFKDISYLD